MRTDDRKKKKNKQKEKEKKKTKKKNSEESCRERMRPVSSILFDLCQGDICRSAVIRK